MTDFVVKKGLQIGGGTKLKSGTIAGNATLDLSSGNYFAHTPTADTTFVFSNPPAAGKAHGFVVELTGVLIDNAYDLANAQPPAYGKFSVVEEGLAPNGLFLKPDGLKMYVICGSSADEINEYNLSSAWDISTASYVQNFSVSAQETLPNGLFFKPDGTKMYIIGASGNDVNEYTLSLAWDISTASYVQNFSVATEETSPSSLFFKPDGTKMYIVGSSGVDVNEYNLSSAWDISTASYVQNFSVSAQMNFPSGLFFKPDGTKMYVIGGGSGDDVNEYDLSSAWDISTSSFLQTFSGAAQETNPQGVFFKPDGLRMYIVGDATDSVYSYTLTSAWDISTASFDLPTEGYFSVAGEDTAPLDLFLKPDGTKMYVVGSAGDDVNEYDLSTAWEVSSASYVQNFSVAAQDSSPSGLFFKPDGTKMYVLGITGQDVNEYSLSSAWDISTASYVQNFSISSQETVPLALFFKHDGTRMYVTGEEGLDVNEYSLSTAWDISTASYVQNFSVSAQETSPRGLFFKPDGTKMYITGAIGDDVNEYSLSTAWDISTASYVQNFSIAAEETVPQGVFFGDNGTKMYIIGTTSDAIWQYTTGTYGDATFTYPASVKWPGGTAPSAPADGETDILEFYTDDAGTTYYGIQRGDDMS